MIVWAFPTLSEEQKVAYHLSKYLDDNCRKQLRAVVGAELIVKESAKGKPTNSITNAELAPVTGSEQKHIMSVTQRKPHPLRFESRNPAYPTQMNPNLPVDFIVIPEDKKGKPIVIIPPAVAGARTEVFESPEEEREGEERKVEVDETPKSVVSVERNIISTNLCPDYIGSKLDRSKLTPLCSRLEYEFEKTGGDGSVECRVDAQKIMCKNTGAAGKEVKFKLKVKVGKRSLAEKEFTVKTQ